jgi:putative oxidoreductase
MRNKSWERLILLLKWMVAALFIFAGISKILNPDTFARDIDNYRLLPYLLVTIMAVILPWLEVLCGIFLIVGTWKKGAAFTLLVLTFMFLIAISSAIARGLDITCGCFSMTIEGMKVGYSRLIEDVVLFALILLINIKELREGA